MTNRSREDAIPESSRIEDYLDPNYYNHQSHGSSSLHARDQWKNIRHLIEPYEGQTILDIGCGSGKYAALMSHTACPVAIDFSPMAMQSALETMQTQGKPEKALLLQARGEVLPFKDGTFDKVTALDFVEHINQQEYETLLSEIQRVLKPGGTLCIYTPNKTYFIEFFYKLIFGRPYYPQHFGLKTASELTSPLKKLGYQVLSISFQPNYVPGLRQAEQIWMHLPWVGQLAKRRISIQAVKSPALR
jgi:ubiquinone/menaquinone biosynthesis C-methylase UbiE